MTGHFGRGILLASWSSEPLRLFPFHGFAAAGVEFDTQRTLRSVASSRGAVLSPVENDLQMQPVPGLFGKHAFEIRLGLNHALSARQTPALGQPMDVGVDGKRRNAEPLAHDDRRRFVADAWERFEMLEGVWNR